MVFSGTVMNIELESDQLIMHGSSGCVLRGVLNIHLKQPMKIKSVTLSFSGTLHTSWKQAIGNGHERRIQHERSLISHRWPFLSPKYEKSHLLPAGDHAYDFELPLAGNLPETSKVANFYTVQYRLEATIRRSFLTNYEYQRDVYVTRQSNSTGLLSASLNEPISVDNQWSNKLYYDISIPSKLFHHGDVIPVAINFIPLAPGLKISHLNCTFKEYASCGPVDGLFDGRTKSHSKILYYSRTNQPAKHKNNNNDNHNRHDMVITNGNGTAILDDESNNNNNSNSNSSNNNDNNDDEANRWCLNLAVPIPKALDGIQCDTSGDVVRVRHQLKFVLSMESQNGRLTELRAALPIIIQAKPHGLLPTYDQCDNGQSYPYDPALMVRLLRSNQQHQQQNHTIIQSTLGSQGPTSIGHHTTTTEITSHLSSQSLQNSSLATPLALDNSALNAPTPTISSLPTYDEVHCH